MKRSTIRSSIVAVFLSLLVSSGGFAQEVQKVEEIKGKMIHDQQGKQLGTVEEVRVGPDGQIESVVVEKGGFLGIGGETNTIPWKSLTMANDGSLVFTQDEQAQAQSAQGQQEARQDKGQQATAQQGQDQQGAGQGQIAVQQPGAQVQVDQPEAQVRVDQAEPKVSVSQPQPKVTVTQPPPQIKVQVEQPKPEVTVQQAQPKVDVQQQEPKVTVQQPRPEVKVQQQKPEVVIKESKPQVQVEQAGQPQVYLEDQQKAQVEVQRQGQPQVDVVTSGQQQGSRMDPAKADQLMGRKIVGKNGQELGTVKEKHLSQDGQSVQYLIVQGEDNKIHPVPAALVNADQKGQKVTAQIDKETFQNSPSFSPEQQPQLDQQQWSRQINSYYGMSPTWQDPEKQSGQQPQEPSEKQPKK